MRLFTLLSLSICGSLFGSIPDNIVRPDFQNGFAPATNANTSAVVLSNGGIGKGTNHAVSISINDPSFESNSGGDLDPGGWSNNLSPDWQDRDGDNNGGSFEEYIDGFVDEGTDHVGMNTGFYIWQDTGVAITPNTTYTLTVAAGNRNASFSSPGNASTYGLLAGATTLGAQGYANTAAVIADTNLTLASGSVDASTFNEGSFGDGAPLIFTTGATVPNENLVVLLGDNSAAGRSHFDNIRLEAVTDSPVTSAFLLSEYSFGTNFPTYQTPYDGFADDVLFSGRRLADGVTIPAVYSILYPAGYGTSGGITANRATITSSGAVFRYKWLMYGEEPGSTDPNPPILNIFNEDADSNNWFTERDRLVAREQIGVLQEALAYDPLNRQLQSTLLDIYYDWAVAEMQFARKKLVALATVRLGLLTSSAFIIDEEIEAYKELVEITEGVLELYGELFSFEMEGFNPADLYATGQDPSGGAPFGYFIFQNEVPLRSQTPTQFAPTDGSVVTNVITPGSTNTFSGFKDYRTILTILGDHIQHQAELGRLRGMRRATTADGDDITVARNGLTASQGGAATMVGLFDRMFTQFDFDDPLYDDTGVRGAKVTASTALNDAQGVRSFLNGTSNILGLDPNFLLLLPAEPNNSLFDTYDLMKVKLSEEDGPLQVALEDLGIPTQSSPLPQGARQEYETFRESVDKVAAELTGLEGDFAARFEDITGYRYETEGDQWNGIRPKLGVGSELATADLAIDSLARQNVTLGNITLQLLDDISKAEEAVTLANGISTSITGAESSYESTTSSAWTEIHTWAGAAAGAQAVADGVYAASGVDGASTLFSGGGTVAAIGIAAAVNTGVQTAAATRTSMREQEIDKAAIAFDTTLALAEAPLTVKQSEIELGGLLREAYSNRLEIEDTFTALAQAIADRTALLREVQRIDENLLADRASLAGMFYADPIHYVRAERKILKAHSAFRFAQRWVFFTCRALEYKWQERFAIDGIIGGDDTNTSFDIGSILKARNAQELDLIVQKMAEFNLPRDSSSPDNSDTTIISLRDQLLSPNPKDVNLTYKNEITENGVTTDLTDDGLRYDPETQAVVTQETRFRQILESYKDDFGNIVIPIDTTRLKNFSTLFPGPDFSDLSNPDQGAYRNKIETVAINIVADPSKDPSAIIPSGVNGKNGRITYGGNTFFRTRVPICPDRTPAATAPGDPIYSPDTDFGSEFVIQPFRFYEDTNFTGTFELKSFQNISGMKFAYSGASANDNVAVLDRVLNPSFSFLRKELKERSVAATRWEIRINNGQLDIDDILDIELIIQHNSYQRAQVICE
jgi:hypothetical protein